jgi:hypothetical protein
VTVTTGFLLELAPASALTVADTGVNAGGEGTGAPTAGRVGVGAGVGFEGPSPISIEVKENKRSNRS